MKNKKCFKCGKTMKLSEFYKHSGMADGHLNKCKSCSKNDARLRRYGPNREKVLEYDRTRGFDRYKLGAYEYLKQYRKKNKQKYKAHIKAQRLKRTKCQSCGATERLHNHHHDYASPKDVVCLCAACHAQLHAKLNKR